MRSAGLREDLSFGQGRELVLIEIFYPFLLVMALIIQRNHLLHRRIPHRCLRMIALDLQPLLSLHFLRGWVERLRLQPQSYRIIYTVVDMTCAFYTPP